MTSKHSWEAKTKWQNGSWKIKTAVSGMNRDLAELLNAAETGTVRNSEEISKYDAFVYANREDVSGPVETYTDSEASTIVRSVTGMDGVEDWARLHANYSRRTLG